jgi:hypothetical protein
MGTTKQYDRPFLLAFDARNPRCRPIERRNARVLIDGEHTIIDGIKDRTDSIAASRSHMKTGVTVVNWTRRGMPARMGHVAAGPDQLLADGKSAS